MRTVRAPQPAAAGHQDAAPALVITGDHELASAFLARHATLNQPEK